MITTAKGWEEDLASGAAQEVEVVKDVKTAHGEAVQEAVGKFLISKGISPSWYVGELEVFLAQILFLPRIETVTYVFYVREYDNGEAPS
jgi:hypothetical protein